MDESRDARHEGSRSPAEPPASRPETGHQLFDWILSTGLRRPATGWIAGVMALLAEKLRWDATLVRGLGVVALVLFFSPVILLYGLAWILVPDHQGRIPVRQALRGDFTAGLFGGALLAVVGALNVFTPLSLAGPFAIVVNLVVIGAVVWIVASKVRAHRRRRSDRESVPTTGGTPQQGGDLAGKAPAGGPTSRRDDSRPAWYPRETAEQRSSIDATSAADRAAGPLGTSPTDGRHSTPRCGAPAPVKSPAVQEQDRRRRLVSFGLVLATASSVLLAVVALGTSAPSALLAGLAGLVVVLAITHMISALRGTRGRGFLLTMATAAMLVTFLFQQNPGAAPAMSGSNLAFGNYTTEEQATNTAFSNTTMDLRHLAPSGESGQQEVVQVELNSAFANTTVVVPDDAAVTVQSQQALGNLEISTQEDTRNTSGFDVTEHSIGDPEADLRIVLAATGAFNNVTVYDVTTYAEEVEADRAGSGGTQGTEDSERDLTEEGARR